MHTVDVYTHKTIEYIGKNFVTFVLKFFHIDSTGITYKCTRKYLSARVTNFFPIDSIGTLQQCTYEL